MNFYPFWLELQLGGIYRKAAGEFNSKNVKISGISRERISYWQFMQGRNRQEDARVTYYSMLPNELHGLLNLWHSQIYQV